MSGQRLDPHLEQLLDQALALAPARRRTFVLRACRDDPAAVERLLGLLALAEHAGGFLDRPAAADTGLVDADAPATGQDRAKLASGRRLGPWQLVRALGSGGMGEVWLAERAEGGFRQQVAVKCVAAVSVTDARRFDAEREILAALEHPGIARLCDGGVAADGQPYMAMEFVEGEDLLAWCRRHRLDLPARLALFLQVCEAVAYAHSQLVVHRDLKPANILVTGDGRIKLLDFGIAHLLQDPVLGDASATVHLSPAYAAPEQLTGGRIGVATDVHALGVVLHELLTGRLPWAVSDLPLGAAVQRLLQTTPSLPSTAAAAGEGVQARLLRGDLDAIVAKALRPEPGQRYPDARALADDVRRHLAHRPVRARQGARLYVLRRFLHRQWLSLAGATVVVLALIGGLAGIAWQARQTLREAHRAEVMQGFLLELFASNAPEHRGGTPLSAMELVDLGLHRAEQGRGVDPDMQIELLAVIARLYRSLAEFDKGATVSSRRLALAERRYDNDDRRRLRAQLDHAEALSLAERPAEARQMLEQVRVGPARRRHDTALQVQVLRLQRDLAHRQGDYEAAHAAGVAAVALLRPGLPDTRLELASAQSMLGLQLYGQGRYEDAEAVLAEAVALFEEAGDDAVTGLVGARYHLGQVLTAQARFEAAQALLEENVVLAGQVYGNRHPALANQIFQLAMVKSRLGDLAGAEADYRQALAIYEDRLGAGHSYVATTLTSLAQVLTEDGRQDEAIAALERAAEVYLQTLGPDHLFVAVSATSLARARLRSGDLAGAERGFREALATYGRVGEGDHVFTESARQGLGEVLAGQGRLREAEPLLRQAWTRLAAEFGAGDFRSRGAAEALANMLIDQRRSPEARQLLAGVQAALPANSEAATTLALRIQELGPGD